MDVEQVERETVARTYRRLAMETSIAAGALRAQAEAFDDAASRIEGGEPVDTLQLPSPESRDPEASPEDLHEARSRRILRAVVRASRQPAHELGEAGLERIAEEAGEAPRDVDDVKGTLDGLIRLGLVESHRIPGPGPRPVVVFIPTRDGFAEAGASPPERNAGLLGSAETVYHVVEQPTREMAAVERDEAVEAGDR